MFTVYTCHLSHAREIFLSQDCKRRAWRDDGAEQSVVAKAVECRAGSREMPGTGH